MRGCPPTQLAPFTAICTQQQITWSFQEIINKVRRTVSDDYVLFGVVSTFEGGKLLQFPVLAEVESWRTLSTLLLYNLRPTGVFNFVELSGRWSAVAGTLAGCLLGLERKKNTMFRIKMGTLCRSMPWHHFWSQKVRRQCLPDGKHNRRDKIQRPKRKKAILLIRCRGHTHSGKHFIGEIFGYTHQCQMSHQYFCSAFLEEKDYTF